MAKNSLSLPDNLVQLLAAADKAKNFPAGTMASLLRQEIEGRPDILAKPDTPHYPTGVTKTGVKSSAFGPFGILESTGRDPGYGVAPLKNKSLEEQVRFAADYLDARSRSAGSLAAGLAGYGEGEKYSRQVARRRDGDTAGATPPEAVAASNSPAVAAVAAPAVEISSAPASVVDSRPVLAPAPIDPAKDPWLQFQRHFDPAPVVEAQAPAAKTAPARTPGMAPEEVASLYDIPLNTSPNFGVFQGLARLGRRAA